MTDHKHDYGKPVHEYDKIVNKRLIVRYCECGAKTVKVVVRDAS